MPNIPVSPYTCCYTPGQCPAHTKAPRVPNKKSSPLFEENFDSLTDIQDVLNGSFSQIFPSSFSNVTVSAGVLDIPYTPSPYWNALSSFGFRRSSNYSLSDTRQYSIDMKLTDPITLPPPLYSWATLNLQFSTGLCGPAVIVTGSSSTVGVIENPVITLEISLFRVSSTEIRLYFVPVWLHSFNVYYLQSVISECEYCDSGYYTFYWDEDDFFNLKTVIYPPINDDVVPYTYFDSDILLNDVFIASVRSTLLPYYLSAPFNSYQLAKPDACLGVFDFRRYRNSSQNLFNRVYLDKIECTHL